MNWLQALQHNNYAHAKQLFDASIGALSINDADRHRLMYIQALKNQNDLPTAIQTMQLMLPFFADNQHKVILLGWLAEALPEYEIDKPTTNINHNQQLAIGHGTQSIALADQLSCRAFSLKTRNAVVYSLFGSNPKYCETIQLNAEAIKLYYPNFSMLVYHDSSVPQHVLMRLTNQGATLVNVSSNPATGNLPGTFWRFLALDDDSYDILLFRDADSVIEAREQALVNAWLASDKPFHIIRDWYTHTDLILAGLWGARGQLLQGTQARMQRYIANQPKLHATHADQHFLRDEIWPRIKQLTLHHHCIFATEWSDTVQGVGVAELGFNSMGGVNMTNYSITSDNAQHYVMSVTDTSTNQVVCSYTFINQPSFTLPRQYADKIRSKQWNLTMQAAPVIKVSSVVKPSSTNSDNIDNT